MGTQTTFNVNFVVAKGSFHSMIFVLFTPRVNFLFTLSLVWLCGEYLFHGDVQEDSEDVLPSQ